jgi:hypothetical protein
MNMTSTYNAYRDSWRTAVLADDALTTEARAVASVLAKAARLGSVAMTDYRRINRAMGRVPGDKGIFSSLTELRAAGWLGSYRATATGWDNGWPLQFPGGAE